MNFENLDIGAVVGFRDPETILDYLRDHSMLGYLSSWIEYEKSNLDGDNELLPFQRAINVVADNIVGVDGNALDVMLLAVCDPSPDAPVPPTSLNSNFYAVISNV